MTAESVTGRDVPRYHGPAVTHRITLSGAGPSCRDKARALIAATPKDDHWQDSLLTFLAECAAEGSTSVRAVCEPCGAAGEPWARTFEGGHSVEDFVRLEVMHGGGE